MKWIEPPGGKPWALLGLCGASVLLNIVLTGVILTGSDADETVAATQNMPSSQVETTAPVVAAVTPPAPKGAQVTVGVLQPTPSDAPVVTKNVAPPTGVHTVRGTLTHSLIRTFSNEAGEHADVLNAVYSRLFFWDLDLRRDLQKGDEVQVAYRWDGTLAHVDVANYRSNKLGQTLTAYRFKAQGDAFDSYWTVDGQEVSRRLINSPLRQYEQVTALIKDRPSHKGMDFKTPVGTEIYAPKGGVVLRTDWNLKYNGNCIEMKFHDGTLAKFLHLSDTGVKAGQTVQAGQRIGATGNTGRSTAPHLHYELEKGGRMVDPVDYHGTTRRTLPASDRAAFERERTRLDGILNIAT